VILKPTTELSGKLKSLDQKSLWMSSKAPVLKGNPKTWAESSDFLFLVARSAGLTNPAFFPDLQCALIFAMCPCCGTMGKSQWSLLVFTKRFHVERGGKSGVVASCRRQAVVIEERESRKSKGRAEGQQAR